MDEIDYLLQNSPVYPLRFQPIYKDYLWGGNRLRALFGRIPPGSMDKIAESWEVCDHPNGQSVIQNGHLRGKTLQDVIRRRPVDLLGASQVALQSPPKQFPLLFKYLDAAAALSIQVHPDDKLATELNLGDRGKTEAWIIINAEPGATLWIGTNRPFSRKELGDYIRQGGDLEAVMNRIEPKVGEGFLIPPGTPHALGKGLLVAEVQTTSDLTFRLFDWNRVDADGNPRELKIEEGIRALSDPCHPVPCPSARFVEKGRRRCERLITSDTFAINKWTLDAPISWRSDRRCHIWAVLDGTVDVLFTAGRRMRTCYESGREADPDAIEVFHRGDTFLVPAACDQIRWVPENNRPVTLLDVIVENTPPGA